MSFIPKAPVYADERTKSLVVNAWDPFEIRDLIPDSRTIDHPDWNVAIRWTDDSAQLLRNMGFDAPFRPRHWPGIYQPQPHQLDMINFQLTHRRCYNLSEMGCVSADTEYLSLEGWRRIDQYAGGKVAQYWPESREIEFVEPEGYVKLPCETMIRFQTTRGVDQLLSPEHRVLLADGSETTARTILENYGNQNMESRRTRFRTTFKVRGGQALPLTDEEIRVQVAVNADGTVDKHRAYVRLKKVRKIERLRQLLVDAEIEFNERPCLPEGFVRFGFYPPMSKGFDERWWQATQHQLEIVADELVHWDGSVRKSQGNQFFSSLSDQADFAQYAFSASGRRASKNLSVTQWGDVHVVHASLGDGTVGLYGRTGQRPSNNVRYEPSPDGFKYCFEVPSTFLLLRRNGCIVATGNTMKTAPALWTADELMKRGEIKKCLIITPLSTMEGVWQQGIFDTCMHRQSVIVHGTEEQRRKMLEADVDFYILNHDGVKIAWLKNYLRKRTDIGLIIVDEGADFRNESTEKYKGLKHVIRDDQRLIWMTGTPFPNEPVDAWAQCRIVNPSLVPSHMGTFKRMTMYKQSQFKWVALKGHEQTVYRAMQPAIRYQKKDVNLNLPPCATIKFDATLSKEQLDAYTQMKKSMQAAIKTTTISAVHAADQIGKLRQILCISRDTLVLTYWGWVPIQDIRASDWVWDGIEWVRHDGLVDNGIRRCIEYDGVWMTPDHEVLTTVGWRTAHEQSRDRFDRAPVRLPHHPEPSWHDGREFSESDMAVRLRLWHEGRAREPKSEIVETTTRQSLRVQGDETDPARHELHTTVPYLDAPEAPLPRSDVQGLQELRRAWDQGVCAVAGIIRKFLGRHAKRVQAPFDNRSQEQRRKLHAEELSMGDSKAASKQSQVYDILNCGPRNRFVVRGENGELVVVHNCGVVKRPDGSYVPLDFQPRLKVLRQIIENSSSKVVVIVPFKGILEALAKELEKPIKGAKVLKVGILNGDVPRKRRVEIISEFKHGDINVLLCHPKVMSHGLNLTEADVTAFWAPIYSNDQFEQVIERFNRMGQKHAMTVARIGAHPMEWAIYRLIDNRRLSQKSILDLYRQTIGLPVLDPEMAMAT